METTGIVFLAVAASVSFALGRTVIYFRNRRRKALQDKAKSHEQKVGREMPTLQSRNRSKRKRQLQQLSSSTKKGR